MKFFFTSFFFFFKRIFISIEVDFIFSYHKSFAGADGTLPELIEPLISYCKKYNYSYLIFEETDIVSQEKFIFPDKAVPLIFISLIESFLRKFFTWTSSENFRQDWRQESIGVHWIKKFQRLPHFLSVQLNAKKSLPLYHINQIFGFMVYLQLICMTFNME